MASNYQREERDWRRQQPSYQGEEQWSNSRSDDDFSMGLGQEGRGPRGEDYGRRAQGRENTTRTRQSGGSYRGRDTDFYNPEEYRGETGWDERDEGFQNSSRWQLSQFRPSEGDFGGAPQYGGGRSTRSWENYDSPQRGWYQGVQDAMQRSEGQFAGRGPRNYKRSDERIEEDINERLTRHGMVDATDIEVTVQNGEVTLRGSVDHRQAKRIAEDIVDSVAGVKEVTNHIKVKQRGEAGDKGETKQQRKAS